MKAPKSDKRQRILLASIRTFARKGFHECRVSDIAEEAGVAYGLVYHYFKNKDEILTSIFQDNWSVFLEVLRSLESDTRGLRAQLDSLCSFLLETYRDHPDLMQVIILDLTRSPKFLEQRNLELFRKAFEILERMIEQEQQNGTVRRDIDPRIACTIILGALETLLSACVLGHLDLESADRFETARRTFVELSMSGLSAGGAKP